MSKPVRILGIAGSLRKTSYNRGALRAAQEVAGAEAMVEIFDLDGIPIFNQDNEKPTPVPVAQFKAKIRDADAILISTPEYNYSIPGVLKNAIDWASRPYGDNAWDGKPVAIMGASPGKFGTARAQYHLRQCFVFLNMCPLCRPEVMIADAEDQYDDQGNLVDQDTRDRIKKLVEALVAWTRQLQK
jgi:chromate reductase